jgi:hypothetical protein
VPAFLSFICLFYSLAGEWRFAGFNKIVPTDDMGYLKLTVASSFYTNTDLQLSSLLLVIQEMFTWILMSSDEVVILMPGFFNDHDVTLTDHTVDHFPCMYASAITFEDS